MRLYLYHTLLLVLRVFGRGPDPASGTRPGLHNLLDFYFQAGSAPCCMDAALLAYPPAVTRYSPDVHHLSWAHALALSAGRKFGWKVVLDVGFSLWLFAQVGLRQASWEFFIHTSACRFR